MIQKSQHSLKNDFVTTINFSPIIRQNSMEDDKLSQTPFYSNAIMYIVVFWLSELNWKYKKEIFMYMFHLITKRILGLTPFLGNCLFMNFGRDTIISFSFSFNFIVDVVIGIVGQTMFKGNENKFNFVVKVLLFYTI